MAAAYARERERSEMLEHQIHLMQRLRDRNMVMNDGDRRVAHDNGGNREAGEKNAVCAHYLRERFRTLRSYLKDVELSQDAGDANDEICTTISRLEGELRNEPSDGAKRVTVNKLKEIAQQLVADKDAMTCSICWEDFQGGDAVIMGQNCYHYFHAQCIREAAYVKARPPATEAQRYDDPYWAFSDDTRTYTPRPTILEANGSTFKGFPANTAAMPDGWPCPTCKKPYADDGYMTLVDNALKNIDADDSGTLQRDLTAEECLALWRRKGYVLMLEPPGSPGNVMLVIAKIFRLPQADTPDDFPRDGMWNPHHRLMDFEQVCVALGFKKDHDGSNCGGGKAFWRARCDDDDVDNMDSIPGELKAKTVLTSEREFPLPDGPKGEKRVEKRKGKFGVHGWRWDYPKPAAPTAAGAAGPSGVAHPPVAEVDSEGLDEPETHNKRIKGGLPMEPDTDED